MSKHRAATRFWAGLAAIAVVGACSGGDAADETVRNVTLRTVPRSVPRLTVPRPSVTAPNLRQAEPGGVIDRTVRTARRPPAEIAETFPVVAVPKSPKWVDSERARAVELEGFVEYLPLTFHLPVPYDPAATARRLVGRSDSKPGSWPPGLAHQSDDPAVAQAATKVYQALVRARGWDERRVDVTALYDGIAQVFPPPISNSKPDDATPVAPGTRFMRATEHVAQYTYGPFMRALVTVAEADELLKAGLVADIALDRLDHVALDTSTDMIGSRDLSNFTSLNGTGQAVVIIDTGVLSTHPAFEGRVVAQGCWAQDGTCPGNVTSSQSAGSGEPCTFSANCDHGTHVAGIAAGAAVREDDPGVNRNISSSGRDLGRSGSTDNVWASGVAPGADIVSYRASGQNTTTGGPGFWRSDQASALAAASSEASLRQIAAVNMSLGGDQFSATCDAEDSAVTAAISTLRAQRIPVVVSTGNSSWTDSVAFPSCVDDAIAVSAVDADDVVASYANAGTGLVDLFAPGGDNSTGAILAAGTTQTLASATFELKQGTSMAAPHVAGAFALLRGLYPEASVATLLELMRSTGVTVTDRRDGGRTTAPRIDLARIVDAPNVPALTSTRLYPGSRQTMSMGVGATRASATTWRTSITLPPRTAAPLALDDVDDFIMYVHVRNGRLDRARVGGGVPPSTFPLQIGYSRSACRAIDPARSYRLDLPAGDLVEGVNNVSLDVTPGTVVDGVTLLLISKPTGELAQQGAVVLAEGLAVLDEGNATVAADLSVNATLEGRALTLHVGMADGQSARESGLVLRTSAAPTGVYITPANGFTGSPGGLWEDHTYNLSGLRLRGSPDQLGISHAGVNAVRDQRDCLGLVYAALNIGGRPLGAGNPVLARPQNVTPREAPSWTWLRP